MLRNSRICAWGLSAALLLSLQSCGGGSSKKSDPTPLPPVQASLMVTSATQHIPFDIIAAVVYKESGFSAASSNSLYGAGNTQLGPALNQTAVGLPRATLGLDDSDASSAITTQIEAYGAWVRSNLDAIHLDLPTTLTKPDDAYDWVWQLARMHYPDKTSPKNLQILFATELLNTLNSGFIYQDAATGENITLNPRTPKLEISSFSPTVQANLQLDTRTSEIYTVDYLQLSYYTEISVLNTPKRIQVVHCPFSVSSCLASQLDGSNPVPLQAHYLIPADQSELKNPVKILQHNVPTRQLAADGTVQTVTDSIVIMLVGNSGRYINGDRTQVNPSWYTSDQLTNLGKIVQALCQVLPKDNPTMTADTCLATAVQFADPAGHAHYQFGDIADYDASIFQSYVKSSINQNGKLAAVLPGNAREFAAGTNIPVEFDFIKGTAKLEVQRLEQCPSGKNVWTILSTVFPRSTDKQTVTINLFDQGPNKNGQQFLRAMAYGTDGSFMGWSNTSFFLSNYDKTGTPGPTGSECND